MTTNLEQAFPLNTNWPAATVRAKLAEAMIGVFDTADLSGEDFSIQPYPVIAVYGPDGDLTLYAYDSTDTTTADDGGISCIVVSGRRYKRSGEMAVRDAAISATTATQPVSPSLGDTYIVPAAPSGDDWASKAKTVATFSARGWIFRQPFVGMMVYVEDEDAIYHYDSGGSWVKGLPIGAIQDGSIPPKKLAHPFAILKVEDQRNAPPGSAPTIGTMYQVGTSPTGDFASHTNEIARWNESASWEFIAPVEGDTIYRKDEGALYSYRSGAWERTIEKTVVSFFKYYDTVTNVEFATAGTTILTVGPLSGSVGEMWEVHVRTASVSADVSSAGSGTNTYALEIRLDSESTPRSTILTAAGGAGSTASSSVRDFFAYIKVPDTSDHTIRVFARRTGGGSPDSNRRASVGINVSRILPSS